MFFLSSDVKSGCCCVLDLQRLLLSPPGSRVDSAVAFAARDWNRDWLVEVAVLAVVLLAVQAAGEREETKKFSLSVPALLAGYRGTLLVYVQGAEPPSISPHRFTCT